MKRFSVKKIIADFNKGLDKGEMFGMVFTSSAIAVLFGVSGSKMNPTLIGIVSTALSVFCALLFGLLIPVIDQARRIREKEQQIIKEYPNIDLRPPESQETLLQLQTHRSLAEKLFTNISFSILVSLTGVVLLVLLAFIDPANLSDTWKPPATIHGWTPRYGMFQVCQWLAISICVCFLLSSAMLLRRMYATFLHEVTPLNSDE